MLFIANFTLRLVDGNSSSEGRVEVTCDGITGTVCDDLWDDDDATACCRDLGYRYGQTNCSCSVADTGRG